MKPLIVMVMSGLVVALLAVSMAGSGSEFDIGLGVIAPLGVACSTWVMMKRTYVQRPEALTSLTIAAFGVKLVFFGAYLAVGLRAWGLQTLPFAGSLAASFIVLHLVEAYFLSVLFREGAHPVRSSGTEFVR